jgi:hypothetical protein
MATTSYGVTNETPDHASVIAHGALTLADRSKEKLFKSTFCQVFLSCTVLGIYSPCANFTLLPNNTLSHSLPHYLKKVLIWEKELFNTKFDLIFSAAFVRIFLT